MQKFSRSNSARGGNLKSFLIVTGNTKRALALILVFFISFFGFLFASSVLAQDANLQAVGQAAGIATETSLTTYIGRVLQVIFGLLGVIVLLLIIYGGFIWMTAGGDPDKVNKAKKIIYNAIIGLIIIFAAFAITTWLMGLFGPRGGGAGGGGGIPGGPDDWGRGGIGNGPIESVYPAPNQADVSIDTRIVVTFKSNIKSDSICVPNAEGYCSNSASNNIEICEADTASTPRKCLGTGDFTAQVFAGANTTVTQTPGNAKTFVFMTKSFLGKEDNANREFMVTLKNGIIASSTGESIFKLWKMDYFAWSFKTNGKMDLDPPQIVKYEVYPYPDTLPDLYSASSQSTLGRSTTTIQSLVDLKAEKPIKLQGEYFLGRPLRKELINSGGNIPAGFKAYVSAQSGFELGAGTANFTVSSDGRTAVFSADSPAPLSGKPFTIVNGVSFDLGNGLTIAAEGGTFPRGSQWRFTAETAVTGDTYTINNSTSKINFIFASDAYINDANIAKTQVGADGQPVTVNYIAVIKSANVSDTLENLRSAIISSEARNSVNVSIASIGLFRYLIIEPKGAGANTLSIDKSAIDNTMTVVGDLSGKDKAQLKTPQGAAPDPYNNSVFFVTFNKAVNPLSLSNTIKVQNKIGDVWTDIAADRIKYEISNQYKTVQMTGIYACGKNACGKERYCWIDPSTGAAAKSEPFRVVISAAVLQSCKGGGIDDSDNSWCKRWGGQCDGDAYDRCQKNGVYYPKAALESTVGIMDMAGNSLNGNYTSATDDKGKIVGIAEGHTGRVVTGTLYGYSGLANPYLVNDTFTIDNGIEKPTYNTNSAQGDDFSWSFFVSTVIDDKAPLLFSIQPKGDQRWGQDINETFGDPIVFSFDRLMNPVTLKPGFGYGEGLADRDFYIRFLMLNTVTQNANPVGYWASVKNLDEGDVYGQGSGDGLIDYSAALLNHNPYDQAVTYAPGAGSGLESITQNCYLPGAGPQNAAADPATLPSGWGYQANIEFNKCRYKINDEYNTAGCVTDLGLITPSPVNKVNPVSFGYMNCKDIVGARPNCTKTCMEPIATSIDTTQFKYGSWVITKDFPIADASGVTKCCLGKCCDGAGCN
ncbi:MAG: pilin [Patescibacteria group bacterium]